MDQSQLSYYDILKISAHASEEEIRQAYRRLAMVYHPDRNPRKRALSEHKLKLLNEAYSHLNNAQKRAFYDESLVRADNDNETPKSWLAQLAALFRSPKNNNEDLTPSQTVKR